ncbi:MAG: hypothetical protein HQK53_19285, partial [Oligoflexia bacterium]|nr:hypothetical protein [Oligoflexia bacterium]
MKKIYLLLLFPILISLALWQISSCSPNIYKNKLHKFSVVTSDTFFLPHSSEDDLLEKFATNKRVDISKFQNIQEQSTDEQAVAKGNAKENKKEKKKESPMGGRIPSGDSRLLGSPKLVQNTVQRVGLSGKRKISDTVPISAVTPTEVPTVTKRESPPIFQYPEDHEYPNLYKEYDTKSTSVWKRFIPKIYEGERIELALKYLGIVCGNVYLQTMKKALVGQRQAYHFYARAMSAKFYESFYKLDDYVESFIDAETFLPIKYVLVQRESKQLVDDLQLF